MIPNNRNTGEAAMAGISSTDARERIVSVGVYENAPKVFTDSSGKPAGIFIDIVEHTAGAEGWRHFQVRVRVFLII